AHGWVVFWDGQLDLDALGWETAGLLSEFNAADQRRACVEAEATRRWEGLWGDDPLLLSVPGMGPRVGPTMRAFWGDGRQFTESA
nr:IS110 family transposase [Actinomycetota bacterium]